MSTHIATALDTVPDAAIDALSLRLEDRAPVLILAFASPKHPLDVVLNRLSTRFPTAEVLGASSAGEFNEQREAKGALSLFALAGDFQVSVGMGEGSHTIRSAP